MARRPKYAGAANATLEFCLMHVATIETRRQRRERLYGPATGRPNKRLCPVRPERAERPAPRLWDVCTAMRLWENGLFGSWHTFDFKRIRSVLKQPVLPYRD